MFIQKMGNGSMSQLIGSIIAETNAPLCYSSSSNVAKMV